MGERVLDRHRSVVADPFHESGLSLLSCQVVIGVTDQEH
jgi:hypothetical protein